MSFNPRPFFDVCRAGVMGPSLDDDEVSGAQVIVEAMEGTGISWCAYALATAWHETAHTMQPVKEANWLTDAQAERYFFRMYDIGGARPHIAKQLGNRNPGDGVAYCGRGYVQLTGRTNYAEAEGKTGVPLLTHPERAMETEVAAKIMRWGMVQGWFTTRSLPDCLPGGRAATRAEFIAARRIINGSDKAALIAGHALKFQEALRAGGW